MCGRRISHGVLSCGGLGFQQVSLTWRHESNTYHNRGLRITLGGGAVEPLKSQALKESPQIISAQKGQICG